jgi:hypothetical protein
MTFLELYNHLTFTIFNLYIERTIWKNNLKEQFERTIWKKNLKEEFERTIWKKNLKEEFERTIWKNNGQHEVEGSCSGKKAQEAKTFSNMNNIEMLNYCLKLVQELTQLTTSTSHDVEEKGR